MMAAQLIGSGGVAVLLLLGASAATPAVVDVALMLALLAAFASVAFVGNASSSEMGDREAPDRR
jgi:multicomponent Na+:H+ antiporter subunit F